MFRLFNCAATGKCIYKDGFDDFLQQYSNQMQYMHFPLDHSMGSIKMYDDRQFCNGHRTDHGHADRMPH